MKNKKDVTLHPNSMLRTYALCAFLLFFVNFPQVVRAQEDGEALVERLVERGFENVRWVQNGIERVYALENNLYPVQAEGIAEALRIIKESGLQDDTFYKVIITQHNVPQVALTREPGGEWDATYELDESWKALKGVKVQNSSQFKVDVSLEPKLYFKNLIITQVYQYLLELNPTVEVSLWPGGKVIGQLLIPVLNDGYKWPKNKVRPGLIGVSQQFRLPKNIIGEATIGSFTQDVYGLDVDVKVPLKDERFLLEGRLGMVEYGRWQKFKFRHTGDYSSYWAVGGSFFWPRYNTTFRLRTEQYLKKEVGVKAEMVRHFRYTSIGFYAQKAANHSAEGGFSFYVQIPPFKKVRLPYNVRVGMRGTGVKYIAGNSQSNYKMPVVDGQNDNLMRRNEFNPLYIKNVINDY